MHRHGGGGHGGDDHRQDGPVETPPEPGGDGHDGGDDEHDRSRGVDTEQAGSREHEVHRHVCSPVPEGQGQPDGSHDGDGEGEPSPGPDVAAPGLTRLDQSVVPNSTVGPPAASSSMTRS